MVLDNPPKMSYYEFKLNEARDLYNQAVVDEFEHQVIANDSKLQECRAICTTLIEQRARIPLDIQAQANYYMAIGRSDNVALDHLRKAVSCCELFELHTGEYVQGREIFQDALQEMQVAMGAEQSERSGGVALHAAESAENGRDGGLLKARGLPTLSITAPSPTSGSRRKLPTVRGKHMKQEILSDENRALRNDETPLQQQDPR